MPFTLLSTTVDVDLQSSADGSSWTSVGAGLVASDDSPLYFRATMTPAGGTETVTNVILVDRPLGSPAHVRLESSADLTGWSMALPGSFDVSGSKEFFRVQEDDSASELVLVQGGTVNVDGADITVSDFQIGRFEVTQELWDDVYNWALSNGYDFFNEAVYCANAAHPVSGVKWYDVVKWCNARSQREGLTEVYYIDESLTTVYKTGELAPSLLYVDSSADGYRLATMDEWYYAAHGGQASQDYTYSGSNSADEVARYDPNSVGSECPRFGIDGVPGTWPVGSLLPNELGLFDMSGNLKEWLWTGTNDDNRHTPGGDYFSDVNAITISLSFLIQSGASSANTRIGFRLARNAPAPPAAATVESASISPAGKGKRQDLSRVKPGKLK